MKKMFECKFGKECERIMRMSQHDERDVSDDEEREDESDEENYDEKRNEEDSMKSTDLAPSLKKVEEAMST